MSEEDKICRDCPLCKGTGKLRWKHRNYGVSLEEQVLALALLDNLLNVAEKLNPPEKIPLAEVNLQPTGFSQTDINDLMKFDKLSNSDVIQKELEDLRSKIQQLKMMLSHAKTIIDTAIEH